MASKMQTLLEQRRKALEDARSIYSVADGEKRNPTNEEREKLDKAFADIDAINARIQDEKRLDAAEEECRAVVVESDSKAEYRNALNNYLRTGKAETRAMVEGIDPNGGYLVPDEEYNNTLIKGLDDQCHIRNIATKFQLSQAKSLGFPSFDTDLNDYEFTSEIASAPEDNSMRIGKREFIPHDFRKLVKISRNLITDAKVDPISLVLERLAYKRAVTEEKAYLTGDGLNKPLGVFTASKAGISTARDVSTSNTTTAITADGLKNAKYALKQGYRDSASCRWIFHPDIVKQIALLKSSDNHYYWEDSLTGNDPDRLFGIPVLESVWAPNTCTTGLYVGILGDFSKYWIVDVARTSLQMMYELYAATNQIGVIGGFATDGMPVIEEAFVRVKLA